MSSKCVALKLCFGFFVGKMCDLYVGLCVLSVFCPDGILNDPDHYFFALVPCSCFWIISGLFDYFV
jgi:hypothetical protein